MIDPFADERQAQVAPMPAPAAPQVAPMPAPAVPTPQQAPMGVAPRVGPVILKSRRGETKPKLADKFKEVAKAFLMGQKSAQVAAPQPAAQPTEQGDPY